LISDLTDGIDHRRIVGTRPRNKAKVTAGKFVDLITRYEVEKNIATPAKIIVGNTYTLPA
jgi:hypothetical protein